MFLVSQAVTLVDQKEVDILARVTVSGCGGTDANSVGLARVVCLQLDCCYTAEHLASRGTSILLHQLLLSTNFSISMQVTAGILCYDKTEFLNSKTKQELQLTIDNILPITYKCHLSPTISCLGFIKH